MPHARFVVLVPVKPPALGKSRLGVLPPEQRTALAAAFAEDTVRAALTAQLVEAVLVATDDHRFAAELRTLGCTMIPDGVSGDLNGTLVQAAAESDRRWPGLRPVALCADLPALVPDDLDAALGALPEGPAFVADAEGSGTTLYTAAVAQFRPRFGLGSRQAHLADGAAELTGDLPTLRHDVDDLAGLGRASALGLGPRTQAVMSRSDRPEE